MKQTNLSRRYRLALTAPVFFSVLAAAEVATAQVTFYGAQKTTFYSQTADNTVPTVDDYSEFGFVDTSDPAEADNFTLSDNDTVPLASSPGNPTSFGGSNFYSTKGALDAAFTAGDTYIFAANGGNLDGQSGTLPIGADAYPAVLFLTGNGYSASMAVSPGSSDTLELGASGGEASATALSFDLYDPSGDDIYTQRLAAGTTSLTIPQSEIDSLTPGVLYNANLSNFNTGSVDATGDFTNAPNSDGFVSTSGFGFEVVPEPRAGVILLAGLVGVAFARRRRTAGLFLGA